MLTFLGRGSAFTDEQNSAYFIDGNNLVLIDCPMSSFEKLNNREISNSDIDLSAFDHVYVLVTHTHGDHISGIGMLIDLLHFVLRTPITVIAPSKEVETDLHLYFLRIEGCNEGPCDEVIYIAFHIREILRGLSSWDNGMVIRYFR